mmetsp:Transcript_34401/g.103657  ORF Transcript_34401/g.103657 Transcript_34401/m.103657 type:complete len:287 (-) Transcript_34401:2-862(-)
MLHFSSRSALALASLAACRALQPPARRHLRAVARVVARATESDAASAPRADANDALPEIKAPVEGKQVRMFGAKLDAGFAGARASSKATIRAVLKAYADDEAYAGEASNDEQAEIFYSSAVEQMNRGRYDEATKLLNRGCYFAGVGTRRGGQMQLWLGQALSAANRRGEALKLMDALKAHPDRDVRKVAKELLFIMKAPPLQLGEESRVSFDMDEFDAEKSYERAPDGTIRRRDAAAFEKPPEYGSVEWVLQQPRLTEEETIAAVDPVAAGLLFAIAAGSLAFFRG